MFSVSKGDDSVIEVRSQELVDRLLLYEGIEKFIKHQKVTKGFTEKRQRQSTEWLKERIKQKLEDILLESPEMKIFIEKKSQNWMEGEWSISQLVEELIAEWRSTKV